MQIIKEFTGYSKSKVILYQDNELYFVRKINNIERNLERYNKLKDYNINIPEIYYVNTNYYDMEYIPNLNMREYLKHNSPYGIIDYIRALFNAMNDNVGEYKNYVSTYYSKLENIDFSNFSFTKEDLISNLPKTLPVTMYHGDLTLDNVLFNTKTNKFVSIDPLTTEYDSYIFDIAKLRQDLQCKWFIRNHDSHINSKIKIIDESLYSYPYYRNNYLLILMLLRVMPYVNEKDKSFLTQEINRLWK